MINTLKSFKHLTIYDLCPQPRTDSPTYTAECGAYGSVSPP